MIRWKTWDNSESLGHKQFQHLITGLTDYSCIHSVRWKIHIEHKYVSNIEQSTEDIAVTKLSQIIALVENEFCQCREILNKILIDTDKDVDRYIYICQCDKYKGKELGRVEKQRLLKSWRNLREKYLRWKKQQVQRSWGRGIHHQARMKKKRSCRNEEWQDVAHQSH